MTGVARSAQSRQGSGGRKMNVLSEEECYKTYEEGGENGCPAAWDSLFCWPPTAAGSTVSLPCSYIFPFLRQDNATAVAFRICDYEGNWSNGGWTNYSECEKLEIEERDPVSPFAISIILLTVSSISLISLCAALVVFSTFRSLECPRVRVHRQLLLSLLLHAFMLIGVAAAGLHPAQLLRHADWLCKTLLVLKTYSAMASVHWMFVEGLLLHASVTTSVFDRHAPFPLYYSLGWGIPALCVLIWVVLMSLHWKKGCWEGYGHSPFIWFITAPMIVALLVNAVFLVNIIRILIMKMRTNSAIESKQISNTEVARCTFSEKRDVTFRSSLYWVSLTCCSASTPGGRGPFNAEALPMSQGLFVSVLYCFLNSEVQSVLRRAYTRRRSSTWRHRSSRVLATSLTTQLPPPPPHEEETALT
ncbi:Calcitonin receptor like protein [Argiope bruennichi]|uniref:Calcitonin receptor like protein n=1 Tax=Argiope bruennichi TaxID=94029 RepID=A0A8T0E6R1_ARGBR|nr:Calcitonin receptor like protein [Argiope bruennichi]